MIPWDVLYKPIESSSWDEPILTKRNIQRGILCGFLWGVILGNLCSGLLFWYIVYLTITP